MARQSKKISGKVTPLFDFMLVQNQAPEGEGSAIPPEPQHTPSTSHQIVSAPQTESFQTETPPTVSHEPQTEAHIEQILPSPSTYQRKHRKTQKHRRAKKVTKLPQTSEPLDLGADETVHKERGDNVKRAITTDASLGAAQDNDNIIRTQTTAMPNVNIPQGMDTGGSPRRQDTTLRGADAQTRLETASTKSRDPPLSEVNTSGSGEDSMEYHDDLTDFVPPTPYDSPLSGGNTPGRDEGRMELIQELMETCTRLEKKRRARTPQPMKRRLFKGRVETSTNKSLGEDASKQGRNDDKTEDLNLTDGADTEVIVEDKGSGEKVLVLLINVVTPSTPSTSPTTTTVFDDDEDLTISQTLVKMRSEKAKEKGVVFRDEEEPPRLNRLRTTLQTLPTIDPKDKGKGVLVEEEPEKIEKVKRRDQGLAQIESDAELAQRLHEGELAELDKAQKERQKQEETTNVALAEEFDEIQARIDADHELAVRLTQEEQEMYTIEERARLLAEFFKRRKKQLAAERAEAIRNKPPTRTQVRNRMITYLKHMGNYTHQQLKHKTLEELQKLYQKEQKWIDDFKPIDDYSQQQVESSKKRLRADPEEESFKKRKLEEDDAAEKEELRASMDIVPRDDIAIDVESLATKYPIIDWKTHILNENMMYYQIIRADGSSKNYKIFSEMLDDFDRQDAIDLHRLVNERYETTSPEGYDLLLWGDLKTIFEPNEEDEI
ncbi:hypothetical protein Tco_0830790 [Tanacetum coccineum]